MLSPQKGADHDERVPEPVSPAVALPRGFNQTTLDLARS